LRKISKIRGAFPSDEAATKLLYLALRNLGVHWKPAIEWRTYRTWRNAIIAASHRPIMVPAAAAAMRARGIPLLGRPRPIFHRGQPPAIAPTLMETVLGGESMAGTISNSRAAVVCP
jgi:hypothetical protein